MRNYLEEIYIGQMADGNLVLLKHEWGSIVMRAKLDLRGHFDQDIIAQAVFGGKQ